MRSHQMKPPMTAVGNRCRKCRCRPGSMMAMKSWLSVNGEAIGGSRNAMSILLSRSTAKNSMRLNSRSLTRHLLSPAQPGEAAQNVTSVRLLGAESLVKWTMPPQGLEVSPPVDFGQSSHAWTFQIITDHEQHMPNVIQHEAGKALKGTKEVDLEGHKRRWCICCRGKDSPLRSSRLISLTTR